VSEPSGYTDSSELDLELLLDPRFGGDGAPPPPDHDDLLADHNPSSETIGGAAINWRTLPDGLAADVWRELREWVEWICDRYTVPEEVVPGCWWRHGAIVEDLAALHTAWTASYDTTDAGYGPIGFQERWFLAQTRLRSIAGGICAAGHRNDRGRSFPDDSHAWRQWITRAHAVPATSGR
jgi:hypothetical protein